MWSRLNAFFKARVQLVSGIAVGTRYFCGDAFVQLTGDEPFDARRSGTFTTFGLLYGWFPGYFIYQVAYPSIPVIAARPWLATVVDLLTNCPFVYYPMFYIVQESVYLSSEELMTTPSKMVTGGLDTWWKNFWPDTKMIWAVWAPLHMINFTFMPLHFRMPFIAGAGLFWVFILSYVRGDREKAEEKEAANLMLTDDAEGEQVPAGKA